MHRERRRVYARGHINLDDGWSLVALPAIPSPAPFLRLSLSARSIQNLSPPPLSRGNPIIRVLRLVSSNSVCLIASPRRRSLCRALFSRYAAVPIIGCFSPVQLCRLRSCPNNRAILRLLARLALPNEPRAMGRISLLESLESVSRGQWTSGTIVIRGRLHWSLYRYNEDYSQRVIKTWTPFLWKKYCFCKKSCTDRQIQLLACPISIASDP